ncbi:peptidoglycan D,D-transpeptidase FtsI family protein [Rhodovulum steppense]|uniref:Cell division protein FtsI (Penicillin-binding protein 3) n=1 Tax=Rhodovulum steppense TaxID=540251 RepID=A0A4R1YLG0_9RHOB|nr:penicillin-binding protein 2 [Rhodovulum steppense]TCM77828.1 cell division protein FtsI (penicillin-binding protein 3) [Rhodovulum steppense]
MIRTPLRPLARILEARARGENPAAIERENLRLRHERMRDTARSRAEGRLLMLGVMFCAAFLVVGVRMGTLAAAVPSEPRAAASGAAIVAQRADIVDRNGNILATNLATHALYAQPPHMIEPARVARELAQIFPDLDEQRLLADFTGERKFLWIKRRLSPEQMQKVHDIGDPGLLFGPREMRLYPNGRLAAHVLGGSGFGREGVSSAEVVGRAGVEQAFDGWLRDPANGGAPLRLSLDLTVQAAVERVLAGGMRLMNAKGATAILMDVNTGEVISMVSLPDFDPNERPRLPTQGDPSDSPLFNRAVQGVYELGSTFKTFTIAQALEEGIVSPKTVIDTKGPMVWGRYRIRDFRNYGPELSVTDVLVKSSNIGTARLAQRIGAERQRAFLDRLGFLETVPLELVEAPTGKPLLPPRWTDISMLTISYGHGLSASPMHLAAGYATLANGGFRVTPTLLAGGGKPGERVVSAETSAAIRSMLREVVSHGTATLADVEGYSVGGKTGTADKPKRTGGYHKDKVLATFAAIFPSDAPRYVLVVTLDEPEDTSGSEPRRTAGWTAAPVAGEIIRRAAPLLGLRPEIETAQGFGVTLAAN